MANAFDRATDRVDRLQRRNPVTAFLFGVVKKFGDDQAGGLAALVAYYGFFSVFPLLLVLVTLLGFALADNPEVQEELVDSALAQFPVIGDEIRANVGSLGGSGVALAIGLVGALWAGLGAMDAAQNAMNSVWDVPMKARPNFFVRRLRALLMLVLLGGALVTSTVVTNVGTLSGAASGVSSVGVVVVTAAVNIGIFLVAFRILTDLDLDWSTLAPGAVVAGVGWTALQQLGGWFVSQRLTGASQTYGTFAIVLGLLSWLYLVAQLTLFAAEVNVVRSQRLWPRSLTGRDLTGADRRALRRYAKVEERVPDQRVESVIDLPAENEATPGEEVGATSEAQGPTG